MTYSVYTRTPSMVTWFKPTKFRLDKIPEVLKTFEQLVERDWFPGLCEAIHSAHPLRGAEAKLLIELMLAVFKEGGSGSDYLWDTGPYVPRNKKVTPRIIAVEILAKFIEEMPTDWEKAVKQNLIRTAVFLNAIPRVEYREAPGICGALSDSLHSVLYRMGSSAKLKPDGGYWGNIEKVHAVWKRRYGYLRTTPRSNAYWWPKDTEGYEIRTRILKDAVNWAYIQDIKNPIKAVSISSFR